MKNKVFFKKYFLRLLFIFVVFALSFILIDKIEDKNYNRIYNEKLDSVIGTIVEKYPLIDKNMIFDILESPSTDTGFFKKFGYKLNEEIVEEAKDFDKVFFSMKVVVILVFLGGVVYLFTEYHKKNHKEIEEIIRLVEKINKRNYDMEMQLLSEDEFSILRNEIYKTMVMLRETAELEKEDKKQLKRTLADISHQLKTPLTSILIMLDDMIDDEDMEKSIRIEFLNSMKRDVVNINFLVQNMLKLAKLDANSIDFDSKKVEAEKIVDMAIKNTMALSDLKNVTIKKKGKINKKIYVDKNWQAEALTNVLKNAIEHSHENETVEIVLSETEIFATIEIIDEGSGMNFRDLKHIFDRFYKGENSSKDSIGIGLSLSKAIIERQNGSISVTSKEGIGTKFTIMYFF